MVLGGLIGILIGMDGVAANDDAGLPAIGPGKTFDALFSKIARSGPGLPGTVTLFFEAFGAFEASESLTGLGDGLRLWPPTKVGETQPPPQPRQSNWLGVTRSGVSRLESMRL